MIKDGLYKVYFESMSEYNDLDRKLVGEYVLKGGKIIHATGVASELLEIGPITNKMIYRMESSLNNGYYVTAKEE